MAITLYRFHSTFQLIPLRKVCSSFHRTNDEYKRKERNLVRKSENEIRVRLICLLKSKSASIMELKITDTNTIFSMENALANKRASKQHS